MDQKLTIQIFKNTLETDSLATIYYHWSAYSESALTEETFRMKKTRS